MKRAGVKRVVLADDHALVRAGIEALINALDGFEVVGEAADGQAALKLVRELEPEVAVMDISMPGLNGLDALQRVRNSAPNCRVLMLSMHAAPAYVTQAMQAGAHGYVLKEDAPEELGLALLAVCAGRTYWSHALQARGPLSGLGAASSAPTPALTTRQREILQLIAEGWATRDIAERLSISIKTVETHRAQLMQRLEIYDVAGLTRYAVRIGLVDPAQ